MLPSSFNSRNIGFSPFSNQDGKDPFPSDGYDTMASLTKDQKQRKKEEKLKKKTIGHLEKDHLKQLKAEFKIATGVYSLMHASAKEKQHKAELLQHTAFPERAESPNQQGEASTQGSTKKRANSVSEMAAGLIGSLGALGLNGFNSKTASNLAEHVKTLEDKGEAVLKKKYKQLEHHEKSDQSEKEHSSGNHMPEIVGAAGLLAVAGGVAAAAYGVYEHNARLHRKESLRSVSSRSERNFVSVVAKNSNQSAIVPKISIQGNRHITRFEQVPFSRRDADSDSASQHSAGIGTEDSNSRPSSRLDESSNSDASLSSRSRSTFSYRSRRETSDDSYPPNRLSRDQFGATSSSYLEQDPFSNAIPCGDSRNSSRRQTRKRTTIGEPERVDVQRFNDTLQGFRENSKALSDCGGSRSYIPRTPTPPRKQYISQLSKEEHYVFQHAAGVLSLKDPHLVHEMGGHDGVVHLINMSNQTPSHEERSRYKGNLFGVHLHTLLKHDATYSRHGMSPKKIKIPTFVDQCITAFLGMDCSVPGILRESGSVKEVSELIKTLDNPGKDGFVVDLAKVDPVTLSHVLKNFLRYLPHPLFTGQLFSLFVMAGKIHNAKIRRRVLHIIIFFMPKANRDLMEVVFLFLHWLASSAKIHVKVGQQMDLTGIATVMAPTLLRPGDREPREDELPAMIAAVLTLLEDQHILHEIPWQLAKLLHIPLPPHKDSHSLMHKLTHIL